jgi:hypothetical protein
MGRTLHGQALHHPRTHVMILERPWAVARADLRLEQGQLPARVPTLAAGEDPPYRPSSGALLYSGTPLNRQASMECPG